jgi:hypothetical protein
MGFLLGAFDSKPNRSHFRNSQSVGPGSPMSVVIDSGLDDWGSIFGKKKDFS